MGKIGDWIAAYFGQNWKTTLGGILAGVPPVIIGAAASASVNLGGKVTMALGIASGLGMLILGIAAKDSSTHSTADQVQQATDKSKQ